MASSCCNDIWNILFFNLRFDVEKECSKIDECHEEVSKACSGDNICLPKINIDTTGICE